MAQCRGQHSQVVREGEVEVRSLCSQDSLESQQEIEAVLVSTLNQTCMEKNMSASGIVYRARTEEQ